MAQITAQILIGRTNSLLFIFLKRQLGLRLLLLFRLIFAGRHDVFSLELMLVLFSFLALHDVSLVQSI